MSESQQASCFIIYEMNKAKKEFESKGRIDYNKQQNNIL